MTEPVVQERGHASTAAQTHARALTGAYAHCLRVARRHYENFPVASLLLPRRMRPHVAAVYAFARTADDFADEAAFAGRREELLAGWRAGLDRAASGAAPGADGPIFAALAHTIEVHRLPVQLLHDLISAFEQDVRVSSYDTFDQVLAYCRLSANPVGRLVLHLAGRAEPDLLAMSDSVCTALQLTNFWQDVGIDLDKGRCYFPRDEMRRFGCTPQTVDARRADEAFVRLMRHQIERTRRIFAQGAGLPSRVGGRLGFELRLVLLGGRRVLDRIERAGCDVFSRRPVLTAADWGWLVSRAALRLS
jgi:squalene synthase HpnC